MVMQTKADMSAYIVLAVLEQKRHSWITHHAEAPRIISGLVAVAELSSREYGKPCRKPQIAATDPGDVPLWYSAALESAWTLEEDIEAVLADPAFDVPNIIASRHARRWDAGDVAHLAVMIGNGASLLEMAWELRRTPPAVQAQIKRANLRKTGS